MAVHEPRIHVETREELIYLLAEAAAIEHNLMCCYLYAAWSLKRGEVDGLTPEQANAVQRWKRAIISVAVEEMSHLTLAGNLATSIGGSPHFSRPNFPIAPGYHPAGVIVELARFSLPVLDHFIYLERPEGSTISDSAEFLHGASYVRSLRKGCLMPSAQDYNTVGHLYRGVRRGFHHLSRHHGEKRFFVGDPASQIGPEDAGLPGLSVISDLASADKAIDTIIDQGEGAPGHSDDSHYNRFLAIRREFDAMLTADPTFEPSFPVAHNPVMRRPVFDPPHRVYVDAPEAQHALDVANALYGHMLRCLVQSYGRGAEDVEGKRLFLGVGINTMFAMAAVSEHLASLPASEEHPGVHAGMTFSTLRDVAKFPRGPGEHHIMAERLFEISEHAALVFPAPHPLAWLKDNIAGLASRIKPPGDKPPGKPRGRGTPPAPTTPPTSAVPPASSTPPAAVAGAADAAPGDAAPGDAASDGPIRSDRIEVAEGKAITIKFRGRRCIHSRFCVLDAPAVFRANTPGEWIFPDAVPVEELVDVALTCPSGAISFKRKDGGREEHAPAVNQAKLRENGPYAFHAPLTVSGEPCGFRATFCRCGASKNKPYCDGSHHDIDFVAPGEAATRSTDPLPARNGPLDVAPAPNGPLVVSGALEILTGTGRIVSRVTRTRLCRCGHSGTKPFCDNTHARIGFVAP